MFSILLLQLLTYHIPVCVFFLSFSQHVACPSYLFIIKPIVSTGRCSNIEYPLGTQPVVPLPRSVRISHRFDWNGCCAQTKFRETWVKDDLMTDFQYCTKFLLEGTCAICHYLCGCQCVIGGWYWLSCLTIKVVIIRISFHTNGQILISVDVCRLSLTPWNISGQLQMYICKFYHFSALKLRKYLKHFW